MKRSGLLDSASCGGAQLSFSDKGDRTKMSRPAGDAYEKRSAVQKCALLWWPRPDLVERQLELPGLVGRREPVVVVHREHQRLVEGVPVKTEL